MTPKQVRNLTKFTTAQARLEVAFARYDEAFHAAYPIGTVLLVETRKTAPLAQYEVIGHREAARHGRGYFRVRNTKTGKTRNIYVGSRDIRCFKFRS